MGNSWVSRGHYFDNCRPQICEYVYARGLPVGPGNQRFLRPIHSLNGGAKRDLANLRLACRATCAGASPLYFKHLVISTDEGETPSNLELVTQNLSDRAYLKHVQSLTIKTTCDPSESDQLTHLTPSGPASVIVTLLRTCSGLKSLEFWVTAHAKKEDNNAQVPNRVEPVVGNDKEKYRAPRNLQLSVSDADVLSSVTEAICSNGISDTIASHVDTLHVTVYDRKQDRLQMPRPSEGYAVHPSPASEQPRHGLSQLLRSTRNIKILDLRGASQVTLESLGIEGIVNLQEVKLETMETSSAALNRLFQNSNDTLEAIELQRVHLTSGTWSAILTNLLRARKLLHLKLLSCGYSTLGSSSHRRPDSAELPTEPQTIETCEWWEDHGALDVLQQQVFHKKMVIA